MEEYFPTYDGVKHLGEPDKFQSSWSGGVFPDYVYLTIHIRSPDSRFNPLGVEEYFPTKDQYLKNQPHEVERFQSSWSGGVFPDWHTPLSSEKASHDEFQSSWSGGVFPDSLATPASGRTSGTLVSILLEWRSISRPHMNWM